MRKVLLWTMAVSLIATIAAILVAAFTEDLLLGITIAGIMTFCFCGLLFYTISEDD